MCASCVSRFLRKPEDTGFSRTGVTGNCELPDVWVLGAEPRSSARARAVFDTVFSSAYIAEDGPGYSCCCLHTQVAQLPWLGQIHSNHLR